MDATQPQTPQAAEPPVTGGRRRLILAAIMATILMVAVEISIVATAMPSIVHELGDFHLYSWVFSAFLLTQAVTTPIYGKLSDLFGRRRILFIGATIFLVASLLCGLATSMPELIAFRALQGLGSGAVLPTALTIVGDIYPARERAVVQSYLASVWGISAIAGPAVGAVIVQYMSWPLVFWINLPLGIVALVMIALFYRVRHPPRRHSVDIPGAVLLVISAASLMVVLLQAASLSMPVVIGLLAVSAVAGVALFVQERRAIEPILPLDLWRERVVAVANSGSFLLGAIVIGLTTFLPTHVQGVMGAPPSQVAFAVMSISVGWSSCSAIAGRLLLRTSYRVVVCMGAASMLTGTAILASLAGGIDLPTMMLAGFFVGAGLGFSNSTFIIAVQTSVAQNRRGTATAALNFSRMFGQAIGAALLGAVVNLTLGAHIPDAARLVEAAIDPEQRGAMSPATLGPLVAALAESLRWVYVFAGVLALGVLAAALALPARLRPG